MYPFSKPLLEVTEQDVVALTEDENIRLDYKGDLSKSGGSKGEWKDELRKDVTAFANTAGGTLVLGIRENNRTPVHWPGVAYFEGKDAESIEKEIVNALVTKIEPPLPQSWRCHVIPMTSNPKRHFVVIHVPGRSWAAPHWISLEGRAGVQFWHRLGTHNKEMGYGEAER